jgi:hypothetical protein
VFLIMLPFPRAQQLFLQVVTHRYLGFFSRALAAGFIGVVPHRRDFRPGAGAGRPSGGLVANHRSLMDALLLMGLLPRTGVLIKSRDTRKVMNGLLARLF